MSGPRIALGPQIYEGVILIIEGKMVGFSPRNSTHLYVIVHTYVYPPYKDHSWDSQELVFPSIFLQRRLDPLHER